MIKYKAKYRVKYNADANVRYNAKYEICKCENMKIASKICDFIVQNQIQS